MGLPLSLLVLILIYEFEKNLQGIKICRNAPSMSHLFFANDNLIFSKADMESCRHLKNILDRKSILKSQQSILVRIVITLLKIMLPKLSILKLLLLVRNIWVFLQWEEKQICKF